MPSTFFGLQTAMRGMRAQQKAVEVVNHNISNANTPGYTRQVASMAATSPYSTPAINRDGTSGQLGTGVEVTTVRRVRDSFLDYQLRKESSSQGRWEARRDGLAQVESVLSEPASAGLNTLLSRFWGAWQTVSNSPEDLGARSVLVEQGKALASTLNYDHQQLTEFRGDADRQIKLAVTGVNSLTGRIAELNAQIAQVELTGEQANDLADQRDLLIDELNGTVKVSVAISPNGMAQVFLGSRMLVDGTTSRSLSTTANPDGTAAVIWSDTGAATQVSDGRIKGLIDLRDELLPKYVADLDALAQNIMAAVNAVHQTGYGLDDVGATPPGRSFFTGSGARDLAVDPAIAGSPRNVAVSASAGAPGDGSKAIAAAQALKSAGVENEYQGMIARLGVDARTATETADNQQVLVDQLKRRRESLSGVSLDEETISLLKYQQAYQASARVVSTINSMLETLVNLGR